MVLGDVLIIRKCILKHLGVKCQGLLIMQIDKYPFLKSVMGIELFTALLNVSVSLKIIIRNQILKPPGAEPLWKEPLRLISYVDLGCPPTRHAHTPPVLCTLPSHGKQVQLSLCFCSVGHWPQAGLPRHKHPSSPKQPALWDEKRELCSLQVLGGKFLYDN